MQEPGSASMKQLSVLMATVFVDMVGFTMVLPLLPFYTTRLGASPFVVTVLISAYAFAQLTTAPLWGRFSDRYGRRPMILLGLMASAVAYAIFGLAETLWLFAVSRLFQGGAAGGMTGVVQAYVADSVGPEDRSKALGWVTAATSAGVMIGPAAGSLAARLGQEAPGFLAAGLCVLNFLFAWKWLPEPPSHQTGAPPKRLRRAILDVLLHPAAPISALIWVYAVGMLAFMGMNGVLALYLKDAFGVTEKTVGWFYVYVGGISLVMRAILLGPAVRRFGDVGVMRLGTLSLIIGLGTMPIPGLIELAQPARFGLLALIALFVPVGTALLFPATTALVSRRTSRAETGQTLGVQQSFGGVSRMLGPLAAGALFERGIGYPFWAASALMMAASLLTLRIRGEAPRPEGVPAEPAPDRA